MRTGTPTRAPSLAWLPTVAFAGQLLVTFVTAWLARLLSVGDFELYAIASAFFVVLVAAAPLGSDKLAAQLLPAALAVGDSEAVATIVGFALRRALIGTAFLATAGVVIGLISPLPGLAAVLALAMAALPVAVFATVALELLAAAGQPLLPLLVLRLGVPIIVLLFLGFGPGQSAPMALLGWAIGWTLAAAWLRPSLRNALGGLPLRLAARGTPPRRWRRASRSLWLNRLATGAMAQAGILALALFNVAPIEVGAYAAATTVVGLIMVLSSSTSRVYAREMALLVARGEIEGFAPLVRRRLRWLAPALALAVVPAVLFPGQALTIFRPEFAETGALALRIFSVAAAVNASLALSVSFLKLRGRTRLVSQTAFAALSTQILLLAVLVPPFGAAGAATAYATATTGQAIFLSARAMRDALRRCRRTLRARDRSRGN